MAEELWPWLSSQHEVSDDRTLFGDSSGGLFGLHVLLNHPGFFSRYVIGSPAIATDVDGCDADAARVVVQQTRLDATVLIAVGSDEHIVSPQLPAETRAIFEGLDFVRHGRRIGDVLAAGQVPGLRLTTEVVAGQVHTTMPYTLLATGLRHVFFPAP
jgi:hypothetical protein